MNKRKQLFAALPRIVTLGTFSMGVNAQMETTLVQVRTEEQRQQQEQNESVNIDWFIGG